ncbi:MAG: hypothetical protein LBT13_04715 [Treponema sp.]|nr:hypothetical protein [Treponema sp.]
MKEFLLKLLPCAVFSILITVVLPVVIDPYNVFHYNNIRDNGVEPNKNYVKMRYILDNPDRFNAYLFGSSRVSGIDVDRMKGLHCYNMTYSEGVPLEHLNNLETFLQTGIVPRMVLIGIDNLACFVNPKLHKNQLLRTPPPESNGIMETITFLLNYFNPNVLISVPIILSHKSDEQNYRKQFYKNGGRLRNSTVSLKKYNWDEAVPAWGDQYDNRTEEAIMEIQKIIDLCNVHNIRLLIFTNPMHVLTYQKSVENGYLDFLHRLSDITEYYNFSSINDVTTNNNYYHETSHYKISVGDMIIDRIFDNGIDEPLQAQGFGYYVTKNNRDAFFALLNTQINKGNSHAF